MEELIKDQTIKFDNHHAGQAVTINGLHMHKRMNGKKYKGIDVKFPLDHSEAISFEPKSTKNEIRKQLVNEIKRVVNKDVEKRILLVETIIDEIAKYSNELPEIDQIVNIRRGAERIAKVFSKNAKIEDEIKQIISKKIETFISTHSKNNGSQFFVKQNFYKHTIEISDNLNELT